MTPSTAASPDPSVGEYRLVRDGKFGDEAPLPEPFGFAVGTDAFKRYGPDAS